MLLLALQLLLALMPSSDLLLVFIEPRYLKIQLLLGEKLHLPLPPCMATKCTKFVFSNLNPPDPNAICCPFFLHLFMELLKLFCIPCGAGTFSCLPECSSSESFRFLLPQLLFAGSNMDGFHHLPYTFQWFVSLWGGRCSLKFPNMN